LADDEQRVGARVRHGAVGALLISSQCHLLGGESAAHATQCRGALICSTNYTDAALERLSQWLWTPQCKIVS
jgi:hypothetical protein